MVVKTEYKVGTDNGHGLWTAGKRTPEFKDGTVSSYTGEPFMHEWEFNRAVVMYLVKELSRCGITPVELSPTEEDTSINSRCLNAYNAKVDLLLSVHANALTGTWNSANGIETLTSGVGESLRIGKIVQAELVKATGLRDRGMKDGSWLGLVKSTYTKNIPVVLVECGFMDNDKEARLLLSDNYRRLCASAIAKGICISFNKPYIKEEIVVSEPTKQPLTKFPDVKAGHWAESAIKTVNDAGIMNGLPDGTFNPTGTVTRAEMAVITASILKKMK